MESVFSAMNVELLSACSALGCLEGSTYQKEPDCLETLKDLIRFLRREDETCDIRRQLGNAQILQNDLLYITKQYHKDTELFETCIRLLVNLTQSPEICFQKVPEDKMFRNYFLEVLSHLQSYKEAFADEELMGLLARKLKKLLDLEWESRREEHTLLMERILLLIRNILHVPADPGYEKRTDDDASVHDQVLWALNMSGMDKLILYIASSEAEQQWCMHAVEIISLMFREQTPEQVAKAGEARLASERQKDEQELEMIRQRELAEKRAKIMVSSARHSRFGGTFCVKNMKSISDRDIIYHAAVQKSSNITFDTKKEPKKKPKNRMPMKDTSLTRRSTLSIRLFLKEFCVLFIENCYNPLIHAVKDHIMHQHAQEHDDSFYLWAMRFFMEFSRLYKFRVDIVSETLSVQSFFYVQTQIIKYLDMMTADKKEAHAWSKRMHLGLKAYGELVASVDAMTHSSDPKIRESAKVIQSNIFYVVEYREVFLTLLKKYNEVYCTRSFLKDLIETTHSFLKMLERYCKGKNTIMVQKKKRKQSRRRRRPTAQRQQQQIEQPGEDEEELNASWDNVTSDLSAMLQGREDIPENAVPFDAASELPVEEQRSDAMVRIQHSLHTGQPGDAIALLRAAREVWPENDIFGAADIGPEDEFMALREIHFTNLNVVAPTPPVEEADEENEEEFEDEEDELLEAERQDRAEEEFNLKVFINKFSHPDVISCYVQLLKDYRNNSATTNHCIVKMLHRVAWDCDKTPLLFQISLFRIFQKIVNDPISSTSSMKETVKFSKFVVAKFFEMAASNPKIFMELLFWKDAKDLFEISEGYGAVMEKKSKKSSVEWREEEQLELVQLYEEYKETIEGDKDVVDHIMEHIIDDSRTRRQIITQLQRQGIIDSAADLKRKKGAKRVTIWREDHEFELRNLFEQHKGSDDILGNIMNDMTEKRSKAKVIDKLLGLGLVQDRKELHKKRGKGGGRTERKRRSRHGNSDEDSDDGGSSNDRNFIDDMDEEDEFEGFLAQHSKPDTQETSAYHNETESESSCSSDEASSDDDVDDAGGSGEKTLSSIVRKLQEKGLAEQILWIQGGLRSTADDREKERDEQAIPIVPLTEENGDAMDSKLFQQMLKMVGISPPSGHEETFWRIPGHLDPEQLRQGADSIQPQEGVAESAAERKKKSNPRYKALKEMARQRRREKKVPGERRRRRDCREELPVTEVVNRVIMDDDRLPTATEQGTESVSDGGGTASKKISPGSGQRKSRVKRALQSDSSDDESAIESPPKSDPVTSETELPTMSKPAAKRSRLLLSSDNDSDSETGAAKTGVSQMHSQETPEVSQTHAYFPTTDLVMDCDTQDSDDDMPLHRVARRRIVESDSDED
ncbi:protein timeless homolog [Acanthaster planci]|uniref:Protein timeless homolog n=1 Tax=Acanthaster planci TaxID=133434 RepID=A0A8B7ZWI5_ACAPL|nr:protein timeless homolog [Acanthaster planci]XP_022107897.1 protein timeless homolog [Acanthaster planci]